MFGSVTTKNTLNWSTPGKSSAIVLGRAWLRGLPNRTQRYAKTKVHHIHELGLRHMGVLVGGRALRCERVQILNIIV